MRTVVKVVFSRSILGIFALVVGNFLAAADAKKMDLKVGDPTPVFTAVDDQGQPWKSAEHIGKKYLVVYFYPGDFTPGCITQAQRFRDGMNRLTEKGVEVVGVSGDSIKVHQLFKKAQQLNFTLLSDEDGSLAKLFGVPVGKGGEVKAKDADGQPVMVKRNVTAARWTFVIGKDGKIAFKNTNVTPAQDSKQVTDFIEKLEKK